MYMYKVSSLLKAWEYLADIMYLIQGGLVYNIVCRIDFRQKSFCSILDPSPGVSWANDLPFHVI